MIHAPTTPPADDVIRLVPLTTAHVDAFEELGRDPDVQRYTYAPVPFARSDAEAWIARYAGGWADGSLAGFAIEEISTLSFGGFAAIVRYDAEGRQGEIGYIVAPAARGRGIGVRALALLTRWGFEELGLLRLELRIDVENEASVAVAERAGYTREGVLRSLHFKAGQRADVAVYSRLASEG